MCSRKCPDATLAHCWSKHARLYGSEAAELAARRDTWRVADSGRFMDECAVLALPVFLRGGVPLKLIEAHGARQSYRGIARTGQRRDITDGENALDTQQARRLRERNRFACCGIFRLRERLGANARAIFVRDFSISSAEATLRRDSVLMKHDSAASRLQGFVSANEPQSPRHRTAERRCAGRKLCAGLRASRHGSGSLRFRGSAEAGEPLCRQSHSAPCHEVVSVECGESRGCAKSRSAFVRR